MIKKMFFSLMLSGILSTSVYASSIVDSIDFSYENQKTTKATHEDVVKELKRFLEKVTLEEQKTYAFYVKQGLATGYVMPSAKQDKTTTLNFVYDSMFDKTLYTRSPQHKSGLISFFKNDPEFQQLFSQLLSTNSGTVSLVINTFDDGYGNDDFRAKRQVEKVTQQIEEYAQDYAAKVFTHVATRGENGPPVYMTPQQRKDFIRSAYMAGAMKLDNESVVKLDAKKLPLNVEDVASIRNGICIYLKYRGMLKDVSSCDVNKPITTQDYVKDGATKLAVEWASGGKNAILADTRMKGVYFPKTKQIDTKKLMYELKNNSSITANSISFKK